MDVKRGIRWNVLMLIGLLTLSVATLYVPHHHHEGRVCVETAESASPDDAAHQECQLESTSPEFKGISKINFNCDDYALNYIILSLFGFSKPSYGFESLPDIRSEETCKAYYIKSHKLRGSPLFS